MPTMDASQVTQARKFNAVLGQPKTPKSVNRLTQPIPLVSFSESTFQRLPTKVKTPSLFFPIGYFTAKLSKPKKPSQ